MLTLIFLLATARAAKHPDCPATGELTEREISPAYLADFLRRNPGVDDPGKFVCCLPPSVRRNFLAATHSESGQNSNPHGPRVLLFPPVMEPVPAWDLKLCRDKFISRGEPPVCADERPTPGPIPYVFSINGGGPGLTNGRSVEMMFRNPDTGELELYDFSFAKKNQPLHKNPQDCINCHGSFGQLTAAGVHVNFEPFPQWTRFIGGFTPCPGPEHDYAVASGEVGLNALKTNPRYRCLDLSPERLNANAPADGPSMLIAPFDDKMLDLNDERTVRILRATPDYDRYKFAILGSVLCKDMFTKASPPSAWIPAANLKSHSSTAYLLKEVANSSNLPETFRATQLSYLNKWTDAMELLKQDRVKLAAGGDPSFHVPQKRASCDQTAETIGADVKTIAARLTGTLGLDRFLVDASLRSPRGSIDGGLDGRLRYLVEGRGIDLGDTDMEPVGRTYRRGLTAHAALKMVRAEGLNTPLRLLEPAVARLNLDNFDDDAPEVKPVCTKLRELSLKAFAGAGRPAPAVTPATTAF